MRRLWTKRLLRGSVVLFALAAMTILAGKAIRPSPGVTWATSDHTQHSLYLIAGYGVTLLSIHDPSGVNLPIDPNAPPATAGEAEEVFHSYRFGFYRGESRFSGKENSALTSTIRSLPYLYLWLAMVGAMLPSALLVGRAWGWTVATARDPDRRSRAMFRGGATAAVVLFLASVGLTIGVFTNTLEASASYDSYYVQLHARGRAFLDWRFAYPTGPWEPASKDNMFPLCATSVADRWSMLGCSYESYPTSIERFKAEHDQQSESSWAPPEAVRPLQSTSVTVPWWLPLPVLLIYPGWFVLMTRRRRLVAVRRGANLCVRCGYDLRSSPARCPECGAEREVAGTV